MKPRALLLSSALITAGLLPAVPAWSQQTESTTVIEDVIVTAQRRSERLQDVPLAITAVSNETLEHHAVINVTDLSGMVPGLRTTGFSGGGGQGRISIRGLIGQNLPIGSPSPVAVYLDGVYLPKPDSAFFELDDVERVEVLRGPQGTLYGRNATAGAINIITRVPGDTWEGGVNLRYGNYDDRHLQGHVSGPISDSWSFGFSGAIGARDSFLTNSLTGNRMRPYENATARGKLRYESGGLDVTAAVDYANVEAFPGFTNLVSGDAVVGIGDGRHIVALVEDQETLTTSKGASITANYEISDSVIVTAVGAVGDYSQDQLYDIGGGTPPPVYTRTNSERDTEYAELRVLYAGERTTLTIGANYYGEEGTYIQERNPPPLPQRNISPYVTTDLQALAAFAQLEYEVIPRLVLVGGVRYNHETRDYATDYTLGTPVGVRVAEEISDDVLLPSLGVNFNASDDLLLYVKASRGYIAPGFNPLPGPTSPNPPFGAEYLWAYEGGIKAQFYDRRVTLNTAIFYYDYTDIAVRAFATPTQLVVTNAAAAKLQGVEVELSVAPIDGLTLSAQFTFNDTEYSELCEPIATGSPQRNDGLCAPGVADRSGNQLTDAPRWMGGVSAVYSMALSSSLDLNASFSVARESNSYFSAANEPAASSGGWTRVDARIGFEFDSGLEFYAYGRNLTDDQYPAYASRTATFVVTGAVSGPRLYGVGAVYRY